MGWFDDNPYVAVQPGGYQPSAGNSNDIITGGYGSKVPSPYPTQIPSGNTGVTGQQDPQAFFQSLFPGGTLTPQQLASKEAELQAQGIRLLGPNAAGMRTKIELPNGQIVDVIRGAGAGHNRSQWMLDGGPRGGSHAGSGPGPGRQAGTLGAGINYGSRLGALQDTPGYQFRFDQGMKALEGSAASKGLVNTGAFAKDAMEFGQGLASTEFDNEYRRLFGMAQLGYNAAGTQGNYGTSYGSNLTDLTTGSGNAQANAALTSGQGWAGAAANLSNIGAGVVNRWPTSDNPYGYGYGNQVPQVPGYRPQPGNW